MPDTLLLAPGLASLMRLLSLARSASLVAGVPLLELTGQALHLEDLALLAPDLVRDGRGLASALVGENVCRVATEALSAAGLSPAPRTPSPESGHVSARAFAPLIPGRRRP
jgi:hypothetical protein